MLPPASVGGGIATDAGGNNVVRYGNMRDNVMGIEAVLADGTIWDGRRALVKDSSGYDLKHLFIGGEGTLGIVTSAVLKLRPATPYETSLLAAITGLDALAPLLDLAQQHAPGTVTAFELMPLVAIDRVVDVFPAAEKDMVRAMLSESLRAVIAQTLLKKNGGGRVAAHEIMVGTPAIRNLIRENKIAQMYSAIQTGQQYGMQTLDQNLQSLVRQGVVSRQAALQKAANKDTF